MKKETMAQIYRDTFAACGGDITVDDLIAGGKRCPSEEEVIFAFCKAIRRMKNIGRTAVMTFGKIPGRVWLRIGRYRWETTRFSPKEAMPMSLSVWSRRWKRERIY